MDFSHFLYDVNFVRYALVKSTPGNILFNWLFIPGGPGADSIYFLDLINELQLPGNAWLIDFPGNGSNIPQHLSADLDFNDWQQYFIPAIQKFSNPIIVGHSFGGMFPLLFPELEKILAGLVILNSTPSLWLEEAAKCAKEKNITLLHEPLTEFEKNPNQETFKKALLACAPYYFPKTTLAQGIKLLANLSCNYHAAVWWLKRVNEINFNAKWIPENVPTLIVGATEDCITPFSLFEKDPRFVRKNIKMEKILDAGHFPWLEKMSAIKKLFNGFVTESQFNLSHVTIE